jgi:hypothetical protein
MGESLRGGEGSGTEGEGAETGREFLMEKSDNNEFGG